MQLALHHNVANKTVLTLRLEWIEPPEHWFGSDRTPWLRPILEANEALTRIDAVLQLRPVWPLDTLEQAMLEVLSAVPCPYSVTATVLAQESRDTHGQLLWRAHQRLRRDSLYPWRLTQLELASGTPRLQPTQWTTLVRELGLERDGSIQLLDASLLPSLRRYARIPESVLDSSTLTFVALVDDRIQGYIAARLMESIQPTATGYDALLIVGWSAERVYAGALLRHLLRFALQSRELLGLQRVTLHGIDSPIVRLLRRIGVRVYDPQGDLTRLQQATEYLLARYAGEQWRPELSFLDSEPEPSWQALVPRLQAFERHYPGQLDRRLVAETLRQWRQEQPGPPALWQSALDTRRGVHVMLSALDDPGVLDTLTEPLTYPPLGSQAPDDPLLPSEKEMRLYMMAVMQERVALMQRREELRREEVAQSPGEMQ